jgi:D-aminopeptidase
MLPTGPLNAITDVPDVWVGHATLVHDSPRLARTGVTVVVPRAGQIHENAVFAGFHSFNGCGEMTGTAWIEESGLLMSPIALTDTTQVGLVKDALIQYAVERRGKGGYFLGVVAETWGGWLNDRDAFHLTREHVFEALDTAAPGLVAEGNVGGGTPMICYDFKGGIGTSSRVAEAGGHAYTVGVLVQANHGNREQLRVDGRAVGLALGFDQVPSPWLDLGDGSWPLSGTSSLVGIIATDAPLLPVQCKRLARRAVIGMARTGAVGGSGSGDLFLAFSTGNDVPVADEMLTVRALPHHHMNALFQAVVEATEEAILNALCAAETMTGVRGRTAYALPANALQQNAGEGSGS